MSTKSICEDVLSGKIREAGVSSKELRLCVNRLAAMNVNDVWKKAISIDAKPVEMLAMTSHPDPVVRLALTKNPGLPVEIIEILAEDEEEKVRMYVIKHPNAPDYVLAELEQDESPSVANTAKMKREALKELEKEQYGDLIVKPG